MSKTLAAYNVVLNLDDMKSTLFGIDQTQERFIDGNTLVIIGTAKAIDANQDIYGSRHRNFHVVTENGYYASLISEARSDWITRPNTLGQWNKIEFDYIKRRILDDLIGLERIYDNRTIIGCIETLRLEVEDRAVFLNYTQAPLPENWSVPTDNGAVWLPEYYLNASYFTRAVPKYREEFRYATVLYLTHNKVSYLVIEHWKDKLVRAAYGGNEWKPTRHYTLLNPVTGTIETHVAPRLTKEVFHELL